MFTSALNGVSQIGSWLSSSGVGSWFSSETISSVAHRVLGQCSTSFVGGLPSIGTWSWSKVTSFGAGNITIVAFLGIACLVVVYRSKKQEVRHERTFYLPVQMSPRRAYSCPPMRGRGHTV